MSHSYTGGQASLWIQPDGPNTKPILLACHGIGDIDEGLGDRELFYCPDPAAMDGFKVRGSTRGAPDPVTVTVTGDVTDTLDALEVLKCATTIFIHKAKSGRRDVFTNYDRTFVLRNAYPISRSLTNLAARTPDDNGRSEQSFELSADELLRPMRLSLARQTIAEVNAVNDLTFCNTELCRTDDSPAQRACQVGYAVTDPATGASANVLATVDGAAWAATAADPFGTNEVAIAVECFELGRNEVRIVVARGTTDAAAPAEIAYSDDAGATWSNVSVGSTNGEFVQRAFALFALDRNNLWLASNLGRIFKSEDGGLSWAVQEAAILNTGYWSAIKFVNETDGWVVGQSNEIARTIDGGVTWSAVTGPSGQSGDNINCLEVLDRNRVWIGYDDGTLWYTVNGGSTWEQRSFVGTGIGQVRDIKFLNDLFGVMMRINGSAVGSVLFTVDGGYTWESLTTPANSGLNALYMCGPHQFYMAGEPNGGLGFIGKASI